MDIEAIISQTSVHLLIGAVILLVILAALSLHEKYLNERLKKILFTAIVFVIVFPTLYMIVSTVYLNTVSSSRGPVHWHADMEIWACGKEELNLVDPKGVLNNKIGTSTLHEHNDKRIHLEGVVVHPEDASLGKFFDVIGGHISSDSITVPTNEGTVSYTNGSVCPEGRGQLQVFAYQVDDEKYYTQKKLTNPEKHLIAPYSVVPPGECIIIEFDIPKTRTDKLCRSFKAEDKIGKLKGERR